MASRRTGVKSTCPMCFESRPLKIVGNCKHSYCIECLSSVFGNLDIGTEAFECPSCKALCPRPWNDVEGLNDLTREGSTERPAAPDVSMQTRKPRVQKLENKTEMSIDLECHFCQHEGKVTKAANLCAQCGNLCFCDKCTEIHARNKASRNHVVVPLKQKGIQCETHKSLINSYCVECEEAVCMMCVMFEHGEHTIEELEHAIHTEVNEVKSVLEPQVARLTELEHLKGELMWLKSITPIVDRQDVLIKDIENHAQKCIDQILRWKEGLKKQVKDNFKVIQQIPESLEKVSNVVRELKEVVQKAQKIVDETSQDPAYLEQLIPLGKELKAVADIANHVGGAELHEKLKQLDWENHHFCPEALTDSFGMIMTNFNLEEHPDVSSNLGDNPKDYNLEEDYDGPNDLNMEEIFHQTIQVDSQDKAIQGVAVLGQMFAVAHPTRSGEPAHAIDIYELPGTFIRTIRDHVYPLYDMSATPGGKLAVLSAGTREGTCCVKLFDSSVGYIDTTPDFDIVKPLSIGAPIDNIYVILSGDGQRELIVTDQNTVLRRYDISNDISNPKRLACGGRFIFVTRDSDLVIFHIENTGELKTITGFCWCMPLKDVTATIWDECIVAEVYMNKLLLEAYRNDYDNESENGRQSYVGEITGHSEEGISDVVSRVSTRAGYTVVSFDQTFKVYKH